MILDLFSVASAYRYISISDYTEAQTAFASPPKLNIPYSSR